MPDGPVISARDLSVTLGDRTLVHAESFDVLPGRTHVVMGPNGAGKSTLLRAVGGLIKANGTLELAGKPVCSGHDRAVLRRATASVFQKPYLLSTTVLGNVEIGLRLHGVGARERGRRARAALELLGIDHLADRRRDGLSGGEAQRVSIARALAVEPQVLFLDEPMASLDPPTRRSLMTDLFDVFSQRSVSAVWVTHDREEAAAVADHVTFLTDGRVRQQGAASEVFGRPQSEEVAGFLGMETSFEGVIEVQDGAVRLALSDGTTLVVGEAEPGPALAFVFPEDVVLLRHLPEPGETSLRNCLEGRVAGIRSSGRLRLVDVVRGDLCIVAMVTQAALDDLQLRVGDAVVAGFKASAVHVLPRHHGRSS
jgi:tungstate transport system ATP-binding protein